MRKRPYMAAAAQLEEISKLGRDSPDLKKKEAIFLKKMKENFIASDVQSLKTHVKAEEGDGKMEGTIIKILEKSKSPDFMAGVRRWASEGEIKKMEEKTSQATTSKRPHTEHAAPKLPPSESKRRKDNSTAQPSAEAIPVVAPATETPATEVPPTEALATEAPPTEAPATEALATEAPATEAPATEALATEAPATEAPAPEADDEAVEAEPDPEPIHELLWPMIIMVPVEEPQVAVQAEPVPEPNPQLLWPMIFMVPMDEPENDAALEAPEADD